MMKVNEIFLSIQGEGKSTGCPTVFLRLTGCNLRCSYCDTKYSYTDGEELEIDEIFKRITSYNIKRVCITGGEPLLHNIKDLLELLEDYYVSIETNGSIELLDYRLSNKHNYVMDVKTPSSGFSECVCYNNFNVLGENDEIKFVISSREDYEWANDIIRKYHKKGGIIFSTVFGKLKYEDVVKWILEDRIEVKFQIQLHKIIWDINKRGV